MMNHQCKQKDSQPKVSAFLKKDTGKTLSPRDLETLNEAAVLFAAQDMRPMSLFEGKGLLQFSNTLVTLAARYGNFDVETALNSRVHLTRKHLPAVYERLKAEVEHQMEDCDLI